MKKLIIAGVVGAVGILAAVVYASVNTNKIVSDGEMFLSDFTDED